MKKYLTLALILALSLAGTAAKADTDAMRTITDLGVNEGSNYYFSVAEGINTKCQYGVIFFSDKASLSVLLAAKLAGKRIKLLNYNTTTTTCTLVGFSIE
ncbi:MAG: hypothetical protein ACJ8GW_08435 [Massilia sp.]